MGRAFQPAFLPVYGSGAPGGSVPHSAVYFDTSASPYTPYVYHSGAWHSFGGGAAGGNAVQLQGVNVSATPPTDGQVLKYINANSDWEPATISSSTPNVVQDAVVSGSNISAGVTLGSAPIQNNLLVGVALSTGSDPSAPGAGWTFLPGSNFSAGTYDGALFWKIAGASESTTQTPSAYSSTGEVAVVEINLGAFSLWTWLTGYSGVSNPAVVAHMTKASMIFWGLVATASASITSTFANATVGTHVGSARSVTTFHNTGPAEGNTTVTATLSNTGSGAMVVIGFG